MRDPHDPDDVDYRRLLEFRTGIRQFLHWSEEQATAVGRDAGAASTDARDPRPRRTRTGRRSATSPTRSSCATTARSGSSIARSRPASSMRHVDAARFARRAAAADRARRPPDPSAQPRAPRGAPAPRAAHVVALGRPRALTRPRAPAELSRVAVQERDGRRPALRPRARRRSVPNTFASFMNAWPRAGVDVELARPCPCPAARPRAP